MQHNGEETITRATLDLLYNISRELTAALDLDTVLRRVINLSVSNVGAVNGSIIVLDESGVPIEGVISVGERMIEATQQLSDVIDKGLAGWVVRNKQGALITNTSNDARWMRRPDAAKDLGCVVPMTRRIEPDQNPRLACRLSFETSWWVS